MKRIFNKKNVSVLALCAAMSCTQANAEIITFFGDNAASGQFAGDGSGLTSSFVNTNNIINPSNGYFIETFDTATAMQGLPVAPVMTYNVVGSSEGCGINTLGQAGISLSTSTDGLGVVKGNYPGHAAKPGNGGAANSVDNTCYGFTPAEGNSGWVEVDYTNFLAGLGGAALDYFGFYWGSVDTYNDFEFFDDVNNTSIAVTGTDLLSQLGGSSGHQSSPASNTYVNIDFDGFSWNRFRVTSTGIAGEFDNIVTGLTTRNKNVPEPTTLAIFGLGLMGLGLRKKLIK